MVVCTYKIEDCLITVRLENAKQGKTIDQLFNELIELRIGMSKPVVYCVYGPANLVRSAHGWFKRHAHAILPRSLFVIIRKSFLASRLATLFDKKRVYKHMTPGEFHDGLC